jgi:hypothetical protein
MSGGLRQLDETQAAAFSGIIQPGNLTGAPYRVVDIGQFENDMEKLVRLQRFNSLEGYSSFADVN